MAIDAALGRKRAGRRSALLAAAGLAALASGALGAEIRTIKERLDDEVVSIGVQAGKTVVTTARRGAINLSDVKHIRFDERLVTGLPDAKVVLLNKDELHGVVGAWDEKNGSFTLRSASLGTVNVSLDAVAGILFTPPPEDERRLMAKHLGWLADPDLKDRPRKDMIFTKQKGKIPGRLDKISSKGLEATADQIGTQTFELKNVEALVLGSNAASGKPAAAGDKSLGVRIRCADGSTVSGTITRLEGGKLDLKHPLGTPDLTINAKDLLELFVVNGSFVYLSDLEPTKVEERFPEPFVFEADRYGWKRDKENLYGGAIRLGGRAYDKGLGVHSYCALTFNLGGGYREFRATIGLDDSVRVRGRPGDASVRFRVLVDGQPAKELPEGRLKKKEDRPEEIAVSVQGAKELTLVADLGNFLHVLGCADWADAHLVK